MARRGTGHRKRPPKPPHGTRRRRPDEDNDAAVRSAADALVFAIRDLVLNDPMGGEGSISALRESFRRKIKVRVKQLTGRQLWVVENQAMIDYLVDYLRLTAAATPVLRDLAILKALLTVLHPSNVDALEGGAYALKPSDPEIFDAALARKGQKQFRDKLRSAVDSILPAWKGRARARLPHEDLILHNQIRADYERRRAEEPDLSSGKIIHEMTKTKYGLSPEYRSEATIDRILFPRLATKKKPDHA